MSNVITYDLWILTFVCLCKDNFLPQLVCLLRSILPAAFYNNCLPFACTFRAFTICHMSFDIWEVRIMSYWIIFQILTFCWIYAAVWWHTPCSSDWGSYSWWLSITGSTTSHNHLSEWFYSLSLTNLTTLVIFSRWEQKSNSLDGYFSLREKKIPPLTLFKKLLSLLALCCVVFKEPSCL